MLQERGKGKLLMDMVQSQGLLQRVRHIVSSKWSEPLKQDEGPEQSEPLLENNREPGYTEWFVVFGGGGGGFTPRAPGSPEGPSDP